MTIAATLNESFRDALVAYYLGELVPNDTTLQELGLTDKLRTENDLYEYLLLDTQVTQAVETSPVASAIASLQQYVNGALLGMEPGYDDVRFTEKMLSKWRDIHSQYPIWAANQQLTWYPSLYIDPSLRMKKSSYFQQLENDINQNRINIDTTQDAVKAYLASFEEVANLTIVNGYIAGTDFAQSHYYFIGKSRAEGAYYWRSVNMADRSYIAQGNEGPQHDNPSPGAWSDWKSINLPVSEAALEKTIRPVFFNNRLFVTWLELTEATDSADSGELNAAPPESDGRYAHRKLAKPQVVSRLRLNIIYKKYDDSWSSPHCYMDVEVDRAAITDINGELTLDTIAIADSSTTPDALLLAMYAGYTSGPTNPDGSADTYKLLRTIKIDKNFNTSELFPVRGLVDGGDDDGANRTLVLRAGILFAKVNKHRFQFPLTAAAIRLKQVQTTSPHPETSGVNGWNQDNRQRDILDTSAGREVTYDPVHNQVTIATHVGTAFESKGATELTFRATGTQSFVIKLIFDVANGENEEHARLLSGSVLTATGGVLYYNFFGWLKLLGTSLAKSLIVDNTTESGFQTAPRQGRADLTGKFVNLNVVKGLLSGSSISNITVTIYRYADGATHFVNSETQHSTDVRNYQQYLARPASMDTPTPANIGEKVNLRVGPKLTTLVPSQHSQVIKVDINPDTLRPSWSVQWPAGSTNAFTIIHGVYITDQGETTSKTVGHCVKASLIELETYSRDASLVSPKISLSTNSNLGIAEFIDFTASSISMNDQNIAARQPIRMNTLFARNLIARASVALENLLSWETQNLLEPSLSMDTPEPPMDFKGANGLYFWELFFHLPFLISHRLNTEQQFTEADYWLSFIFDPSRRGDSSGRPDYWNVRPLVDVMSRERSTRAPVDPDGIASDNPVHYRKAVYNHFIKNLLDRGDSAYRQLTPDALNEAKLWYVRALDLLGPRPDKRLVSGWNPLTLEELTTTANGKLRAFEARLNDEARLLAQSAHDNDGITLIFFNHAPLALMPFTADPLVQEVDSPYFRVALNRELVQHWDTAEGRLRNLRNNRTLDGKPLQLPLFAAPLDPRALLSAFGSGATGGAGGRLLAQEIPHYRFSVMHNRASAAVENLIQFGSTLLSLLERKDSAHLQEMQQQQAWDMAKQAIVLQQLVQAVEAEGRKALLANRTIAESRLAYYGKLADEVVSAGEISAGALHLQGRVAEGVGAVSEAIGEGLKVPPNQVGAVGGVIAGMAGGAIVGATTGGWRLEGVPGIAAAISKGVAASLHGAAEALDRTEQYRRRHQEWMHAEEQAQREIDQIDAQLAVHDEQAKVTAEQLRQTELMVDQAATTYQFLSKRFTNAQLYQWLNGQFATFYYQAYDTTLSLCLAAEACWQYEIADLKTRFIQPGAWKDSYRGLTAGESLKLNLMKMEAAYLQRNARQLEITKTVSVRRLLEAEDKPWTTMVADLGKTGGLEIKLEQGLFDNDYPGQYLRRIKRVSVTLPAVLGPYEDVAAVLTQTYSKVEMNETVGVNTWENMRASQQIALSSGVDDDGMFTLNFDDERYLPFEGTGAVSSWNLRFTRHTPELLASLNDVIVRVSYTAKSA